MPKMSTSLLEDSLLLRIPAQLLGIPFLLIFSSCLTPPLVLPNKARHPEQALKVYPKGSRVLELDRPGGGEIRGIYCPKERDGTGPAPVALHLLESGASVFDLRRHFGLVTEAYNWLGYSSLLFDYSGVGISDGKRSTKNLASDALAAYQEAVRLAGGEESRVLVRATSLGTIALAELLESGANPGALVVISPVDPADVAPRAARIIYGSLASCFVSAVFGSASDADLKARIDDLVETPQLLVMGEDDRFVSAKWREKMRQTSYFGPHVPCLIPGGHAQVAGLARDILMESELPFLLSETPLTKALSGQERRDLIAKIILRPHESRSEEDIEALLNTDDPSGGLPLDLLESLTRARRFRRRLQQVYIRENPLSTIVDQHGLHSWSRQTVDFGNGMSFALRSDARETYEALLLRGYAGEDLERVFSRLLLKSYAIPDRLIPDERGGYQLQQRIDGEWIDFRSPP